jgi:hypothetical protein
MELFKAYIQVLCWLCTEIFEEEREIYQPGLSISLSIVLLIFTILFPNSSLGCHPCSLLLLIKIELGCFCGLETKLYVLIKL